MSLFLRPLGKSGGFMVFYENTIYLGEVQTGDDGYFVFWPDMRGGCWNERVLTLILNKLKELNKDFDEQIKNDNRVA